MEKRNHISALRRSSCIQFSVQVLAAFIWLSATVPNRAEVIPDSEREAALQVYQTEHFAIQHDVSEAWAAELGGHLESFADQFYRQAALLGAEPARRSAEGNRLAWLCLTSGMQGTPAAPVRFKANYDTRLHRVNLLWTRADGAAPEASPLNAAAFEPDGLALPGCSRQILFSRLSHEAAHQLAFDCGLQKRGVMYPLWVAEGLATNFESPEDEIRFLGPNPARQARLKEIAGRQALLPLSQLAVITDTSGLSPQERIDLYAQVWGLFRFLAQEQRPALISYLRTLAALPCGQRTDGALLEEMRHSFGPLSGIEKEWRSWLLANSLS